MKYMLLFSSDEKDSAWFAAQPVQAQAQMMDTVIKWTKDNRVVSNARLQPPATATTIRFGDDGPVLTDGPYIEAKESIGGFCVIEADDLDQALRVAKTWPARGIVEVRPVIEPPQA